MRRLKTLRRPPIYPKTPGHLPCSSLTHPLPLSSRRPSVSFGGFGLTPKNGSSGKERNTVSWLTCYRMQAIRGIAVVSIVNSVLEFMSPSRSGQQLPLQLRFLA